MLDSDFFELVSSKDDPVSDCVWKCFAFRNGPGIVHIGADGRTPLAAFHVESSTSATALVPLLRSPGYGLIYQKDQVLFDPVITNLTTIASIDYNLMRKDEIASEVDPGPLKGFNQVNELRPLQSYRIPCDQATKREMILRESQKDGKAIPLLPHQKEEADPKEDRKTEFFLTVAPQNIPDMVQLFQSSSVVITDLFVIRVPKDRVPKCRLFGGGLRENEGFAFAASIPDGALFSPMSVGIPKGSGPMRSSVSRGKRKRLDDQKELLESAHAAELSAGKQVSVSSGYTGFGYDFAKSTKPLRVVLAVNPKLKFTEFGDEKSLREEAEERIQQWMNQDWKLFTDKVDRFKAEECLVCLSEKPDVVFSPCAHLVVDHECVQGLEKAVQGRRPKCPLCRQPIKRKMGVDALLSG